ncbi:MAG: 8-amino-7-oxononanoate synthase [Planctomycetota bacterium]
MHADHGQPATRSPAWLEALSDRLLAREREDLRRARRDPIDAGLIDLSSNDYLALRCDARLIDASARAGEMFGVGSGASRLVREADETVRALERRFAAFKHAEEALLLTSGYVANLAVLTSLVSPGDLILLDKLCHASLLDGARLTRATIRDVTVRTFPHLAYERAHDLATRHQGGTVWLVTDSVFSMDGDVCDLPALAHVREVLPSCAIVLDEAHATGVLGETGAGLNETAEPMHRADVVVSTASKALGSLGGIVSGTGVVIESLVNFARGFVYSTGVTPTQVAAIGAALDVVRAEPDRRARLRAISGRVRGAALSAGFAVPASREPTPIVPLVVGEAERAVRLAGRLREAGVFAPAIRPPSVAPGSARVRLSLHAGLTDQQIACVERAIASAGADGAC